VARWTTPFLLILALAAPRAAPASDLREQSARDWDARGLTRIEVGNARGETSVSASRDGRVHLVALKIVRNGDRRGGDQLARDTRVEAEVAGGTLKLYVRYPQHREIHLDLWDVMKGIDIPEVEVRLSILVPPASSVRLQSASGDLQTSGIGGRQDLQASSGDVEVTAATGALAVATHSGDATLTDVNGARLETSSGAVVISSARGPVTVHTGSGDVRVDSASDSLSVETSSGEVRIGLARSGLNVRTGSGDVIARAGGRVRVRTESGEAKVALIAPLHAADLATGSGDLSVRVAQGIEGRLDADAGSGDVDVQLPMIERTSRNNHIVGRMGRGNTDIVIRSSSGSVNVAR